MNMLCNLQHTAKEALSSGESSQRTVPRDAVAAGVGKAIYCLLFFLGRSWGE